ncbi:MAG: permease-like cell division protein FtsX [candidate division Zixibacteria bacterium]|nr:permease-like cell division protein FtsX [candidate division Zixibacteria bacterium]
MSRVNHILSELGHNLYRFPGTAIGALLSLALLFLLFDLYWIATATTEQLYTNLLSELRMEVFVAEGVIDADIPRLQSSIAQTENVTTIEYMSRDKARDVLHKMLGADLLVGYDSANPLPRSFILEFEPDAINSEDMAFVSEALSNMTDVAEVSYSHQWLKNTEETRTIIRRLGLVLGVFILLTAIISSVNNIRLITRTRAVGFQQKRMLGAGRLFLAFPFLIEGMLISGLSAAAGWLAIKYGSNQISLTQIEIVYPATKDIVIFCAAAMVLGIISSYLGIRKLLR